MADRISASICIGGRLPRRKPGRFLAAIEQANVSLEWGDACYRPKTAEELLSSLEDGRVWVCDDEVAYGEFPDLEEACRRLKLPYTRYSEGKYEYDPEVADWRPRMRKVLSRMGTNNGFSTYLPTEDVEEALKYLEAGRIARAQICPQIPPVPPFEII